MLSEKKPPNGHTNSRRNRKEVIGCSYIRRNTYRECSLNSSKSIQDRTIDDGGDGLVVLLGCHKAMAVNLIGDLHTPCAPTMMTVGNTPGQQKGGGRRTITDLISSCCLRGDDSGAPPPHRRMIRRRRPAPTPSSSIDVDFDFEARAPARVRRHPGNCPPRPAEALAVVPRRSRCLRRHRPRGPARSQKRLRTTGRVMPPHRLSLPFLSLALLPLQLLQSHITTCPERTKAASPAGCLAVAPTSATGASSSSPSGSFRRRIPPPPANDSTTGTKWQRAVHVASRNARRLRQDRTRIQR